MLEGTDTIVVADEAYSALVYDGADFVSALEVPSLAGRTVLCQTFSKRFAMTGWRIGYVGDRVPSSTPRRGFTRRPRAVNTAVQRASMVAMDTTADVDAMVVEYAARRDLMVRLLAEVPGLVTRGPRARSTSSRPIRAVSSLWSGRRRNAPSAAGDEPGHLGEQTHHQIPAGPYSTTMASTSAWCPSLPSTPAARRY